MQIFILGFQFITTTNAVAINYLQNSDSEASAAESAGFDSFGGFGGWKGFHQFNGLMSNAFVDLDSQLDSTGYATSSNRRFDQGRR